MTFTLGLMRGFVLANVIGALPASVCLAWNGHVWLGVLFAMVWVFALATLPRLWGHE